MLCKSEGCNFKKFKAIVICFYMFNTCQRWSKTYRWNFSSFANSPIEEVKKYVKQTLEWPSGKHDCLVTWSLAALKGYSWDKLLIPDSVTCKQKRNMSYTVLAGKGFKFHTVRDNTVVLIYLVICLLLQYVYIISMKGFCFNYHLLCKTDTCSLVFYILSAVKLNVLCWGGCGVGGQGRLWP